MNRLRALAAAFIVTAFIAGGTLAVGVSAATNPDGVPASDSPTQAAGSVTSTDTSAAQAQINQLQNLIQQYQDREKQYQDREKQYQAQLDQANSQIQSLQQVLVELQQRGVIRVTRDGRILLPQSGFGSDGN